MLKDKLKNKKILIWGYGREGKSTENFLKKYCECSLINIAEGDRSCFELDDYDYVIKSPGIANFETDSRLTSQTQLFFEQFRDQIIGITGTKGKSTTASMLYHVLEECGKKAVLVGNIGLPCLDYFEEIDEDTVIVFELSCHQLNNITVSPHIAVILNLYEEHLDYYGTYEKYCHAKKNIARFQKKDDFFLMGDNVGNIDTDASVQVLWQNKKYDYDLSVLGEHNLYNAEIAANIAVQYCGCERFAVKQALKSFKGLSHRLEYAGEKNGIAYYDDSISTIPEALICAAASVPGAQTLLVGGMDRGIDYDILIDFIKQHNEYKFICMYDSGKRIYDAIGEKDNLYYEADLNAAMKRAAAVTDTGRAVVLSPAAASYGYFKNFEERGDVFKSLIKDV